VNESEPGLNEPQHIPIKNRLFHPKSTGAKKKFREGKTFDDPSKIRVLRRSDAQKPAKRAEPSSKKSGSDFRPPPKNERKGDIRETPVKKEIGKTSIKRLFKWAARGNKKKTIWRKQRTLVWCFFGKEGSWQEGGSSGRIRMRSKN